MLKFLIKVGVAGAAVYYIKEEGIWGSSEQSAKALDRINAQIKPHLEQLKSVIPYELPEVPNTIQWKQTWNNGVIATFKFLSELPDTTTKFATDSVSSLLANPEVKKLLENKPESEKKK